MNIAAYPAFDKVEAEYVGALNLEGRVYFRVLAPTGDSVGRLTWVDAFYGAVPALCDYKVYFAPVYESLRPRRHQDNLAVSYKWEHRIAESVDGVLTIRISRNGDVLYGFVGIVEELHPSQRAAHVGVIFYSVSRGCATLCAPPLVSISPSPVYNLE